MPDSNPEAVRLLLKPAAVRERAHQMLRLGLEGRLAHFSVRPERLPACGCVIVTSHGRPGRLKRALAVGVRGVLP